MEKGKLIAVKNTYNTICLMYDNFIEEYDIPKEYKDKIMYLKMYKIFPKRRTIVKILKPDFFIGLNIFKIQNCLKCNIKETESNIINFYLDLINSETKNKNEITLKYDYNKTDYPIKTDFTIIKYYLTEIYKYNKKFEIKKMYYCFYPDFYQICIII